MLDPIAVELAARWGFEPDEELPGGHCSRVYANGTRVLKVPFQGEEQTSGRVAAVRMSGGVGPRVFESDEASGALLMERIVPGTTLADSGLDDEACRAIILDFTRRISALDPTGLMPVSEYVNPDRPMAITLLESTRQEVFLHGDLHHENILLGAHGWVVIDPKGLAGDPAFEPSAYLRSPFHAIGKLPELDRLIEGRIEALARETGWDPWRMAAWSVLALGTDENNRWDRVYRALADAEERLRGGGS